MLFFEDWLEVFFQTGARAPARDIRFDHERWVAYSKLELQDLENSNDWRAIPTVLHLLGADDNVLREEASKIVIRLVQNIPIHALPEFETRARTSTCSSFQWHVQGTSLVAKYEWAPQVWAMFTLNSSGYVREAALRHLMSINELQLSLPYLLLRVNDWVEPVRNQATEYVRSVIKPQHIAHWACVLGLLAQIRSRTRADHS